MSLAGKAVSFLYDNFIIVILSIVAIAVTTAAIVHGGYSISSIALCTVSYFLLSVSVLFPKNYYYTLFKHGVVFGVPLAAFLVLIGHYIKPQTMDWLSFEDGPVENFSAIALLVASVIWLIYFGVQAWQRRWFTALMSLMTALVLFVLGMEEISWMQRILDVSSNEFFMTYNGQAETNLHNLNSTITGTLYCTFGVLALVVVPFYREKLSSLLLRNKVTSSLTTFLPSSWMALPFSVIVGFVSVSYILSPSRFLMLAACVFSLTILIKLIMTDFGLSRFGYFSIGLFTLATALVSITAYSTFKYDLFGVRDWYSSEFLELFIAVGLLVYTVDRMFKKATLS